MKTLLSIKISEYHFILHKVQKRKLSLYKETFVNVVVAVKEKASNLILQNIKPKGTIKHLRRGKNTHIFCQYYFFNNHEIFKNHGYLLVLLEENYFSLVELKSFF